MTASLGKLDGEVFTGLMLFVSGIFQLSQVELSEVGTVFVGGHEFSANHVERDANRSCNARFDVVLRRPTAEDNVTSVCMQKFSYRIRTTARGIRGIRSAARWCR